MECVKCDKKAIFLEPTFCKDHFIKYFEDKVLNTIKKYDLIDKDDKIVVAVSGGKDSLVLLYILNNNFENVEALCIDEGIQGYRDKTIKILKDFCSKHNVNLNIKKFQKEFGKPLDIILKENKIKPCTVCGVFRSKLMNKYSKEYDVIATGHNRDDISQAILMDLLKYNLSLLSRLSPVSGTKTRKGFTKKIKPLYFISEKEVMAYSIILGIRTGFEECPNVEDAYRLKVRDELNRYEIKHLGTKKNIVDWYIKNHIDIKEKIKNSELVLRSCNRCGEPTSREICNSCTMEQKILSKDTLKVL